MPTAVTEETAKAGGTALTGRLRGRPGTGPEPPSLILRRYRLGRSLGSGAFGTVYAGRDERLERDVAIKILPRERIVGGRFEREARAAARLSHPAIVTLYEAAVDDDGAYLVSELVRGRTLDEMLASGRLSDRDILAIALSLCDALIHAHEQGVIHRDVKPSNVLVAARPTSAAHPAKLTDFGVARVVGGDSLTRTGDVVGTLAYMAPEQAEGRHCGPAADLYSLALVVYEALTGVNPVRDLRGGRPRRLGVYLPPLRRQRRDLPRSLGVAIDQALRPRPGERGNVVDLRRALASCLDEVADVAGVVVPGWSLSEPDPDAEVHSLPGPKWRDDQDGQARAAGRDAGGTERAAREPSVGEPSVVSRGLAAICAAATAAWIVSHLLSRAPLAPSVAALLSAGAVLVLPRLGWVCSLATLAGMVALQGKAEAALVLLAVTGLTALLMPRRASTWPVPAGAAALAVIGLAGAWPALIVRLRLGLWHRAMLSGCGFLWLAVAGPLGSIHLFTSQPKLPRTGVWTGSLSVTLHDVAVPLVTSGVPAAALVWGGAAAVLPWLIRSGRAVWNVAIVTVWSAVTVSAVQIAGPSDVYGLVGGAVVGAVVLVAADLPELIGRLWRGEGMLPRLP